MSQRPHLTQHVVFLVVCTGAIAASFLLSVNTGSKVETPWLSIPLPSVCQFRNVTGLNCPGCGLTRAFVSIAHGRFIEAWNYNAASLLVFAFVTSQIPYRALQIWRIRSGRGEIQMPRTTNTILIVVAGAVFAQWIVRLVLQAVGSIA